MQVVDLEGFFETLLWQFVWKMENENITAEGKVYWFSTELDNWCGEESYTWEQKDVLLSLQSTGSQISGSKKAKIENFTQLRNELRKDKILRVVQNWDKGEQNGARCSLYLGLKEFGGGIFWFTFSKL